jgi:peroxiredoxin
VPIGTTSDDPRSSRCSAAPAAGPLAPGAAAPPFALRRGPHRAAALADFRGRPLVLAFYVADWHPVCTAQLERLRDALPELEGLGAGLVAISPDTLWSHAAFARALGLPFPLLADDRPRGAVARAYGAYDAAAGAPRRALLVVDARGAVTWSESFPEAVDPGVDGLLTALEALPPPAAAARPAPRLEAATPGGDPASPHAHPDWPREESRREG